IWEGSEYRGRGRRSVWDVGAKLRGNTFERVSPINMWNLDKKIDRAAPDELKWTALTTGGFGGADIVLGDASSGTLSIATALVKAEVRIADIGREDIVLGSGGGPLELIRRRAVDFLVEVPHVDRRHALERVAAKLRPSVPNRLSPASAV